MISTVLEDYDRRINKTKIVRKGLGEKERDRETERDAIGQTGMIQLLQGIISVVFWKLLFFFFVQNFVKVLGS